MKVTVLTTEESVANLGASLLVELGFADLTDGDAQQTIALFNVAHKMAVRLLFARLSAAFVSSDATLLSTALTVGDGNSTTRFLASMELNDAGAEVYVQSGALSTLYQYTGDDTVDATVDGTAAKLLSSHTAGKVCLYFKVVDARNP